MSDQLIVKKWHFRLQPSSSVPGRTPCSLRKNSSRRPSAMNIRGVLMAGSSGALWSGSIGMIVNSGRSPQASPAPISPRGRGRHDQDQALAALRYFFDVMVTRHAVVLNPFASVRGVKYSAVDGKTGQITVSQAKKLFKSLDPQRRGFT